MGEPVRPLCEGVLMSFDPTAVPIRPAVSVIMVRDGDSGLEAFVQHRVTTMDFAAGVVVFPGGRVDPVDRQGLRASRSTIPTSTSRRGVIRRSPRRPTAGGSSSPPLCARSPRRPAPCSTRHCRGHGRTG